MDVKFEAQKDSLCKVAREICSSMLKKFEALFEEKFKIKMKK